MNPTSSDPALNTNAPTGPSAGEGGPPAASWLALLAGTVVVAAVGGFTGWVAGSRLVPSAHSSSDKKEELSASPKSRLLTRGDLNKIDEYISEERYADALAQLRPAVESGQKQPLAVCYRAGLCQEGLGKPTEAIEYYRACLTKAANPPMRIAAQFGLARSALWGGKEDEAQVLLCDLLTRSADPAFRSHPYREEAAFLLARALARPFQENMTPHAAHPQALARASLGLPVERYLHWGETAPSSREEASVVSAPIAVTSSINDSFGYRVTAVRPQTEVREALDHLAAAAGMGTSWADGAAEALAGRRVDLACRDAPLSGVVDWLTIPHGILAEHDGKTLTLWRIEGLPAEARKKARREQAVRGLRAALVLANGHPAVGELFLELGNLEASSGRWKEAAAWYERLAREHPRADALTSAYYNLGLLRLADGNHAGARQALYGCIDRAPAHTLAPLSYWWVGRTYLDEKAPDMAILPLGRARGLQPGSSAVGAAVLGLAIRHLLKEEPRQALKLLIEHDDALRGPKFRQPRTLLIAFAKTRLPADDRRNNKDAAMDLLSEVTGQDGKWLGTAFRYIRGQAMRDLGLHDEMLTLHDGASPEDNPLVREMRFHSAKALLHGRAANQARPRLEKLAVQADSWGRRAKLALAGLDLREGRDGRCLELCRELLDGTHEDRRDVLTVMSRAFVARRDYVRAAEALAGRPPVEAPER